MKSSIPLRSILLVPKIKSLAEKVREFVVVEA